MGETKFRRGRPNLIFLAAGLVTIAISAYGFMLLRERPGVPSGIDRARLVRIDGIDVISNDERLALAGKSIGMPADFYVRTPDGGLQKITAPIVPYYGQGAILWIYLVIGLFSFGLAVLTYLLRPGDRKARVFYWMGLMFAAAVMINVEGCRFRPDRWLTYLPSALFILGYSLVPALLLRFSLTFFAFAGRLGLWLVFLPGLILAGIQEFLFFSSFLRLSPETYRIYDSIGLAFRAYLIVFALTSIFFFILAHRKSEDEESSSQIKWISMGLVVGLFPFLFLYELPKVLSLAPPLSEEASALFFIALPVAMTIAIVKYRLMDVVLVINRGLVYSILTVFIVGVYILVVQGTQSLLARNVSINKGFLSVIGVFAAAALFQPAQKRIQEMIDRSFFRQRYDHRRTVYEFNQQTIQIVDRDGLLGYFLQTVRRVIPVETSGLSLDVLGSAASGPGSSVCLGDVSVADPTSAFGPSATPAILARRSAVEAEDLGDSSWDSFLRLHKLELVVGLPLSPALGSGWLLLGKKKSGGRFSRDDLELLGTLAAELGISLERILLKEEVIYERASKEKLDELNRLKTEFISTVSHELRTPMSSIQGLAEILQAGKFKTREQRERYINLMVAESGRLSRFLHNVLDFGRIERQAKTYHFQNEDLRMIITEAVEVFRAPLESQGFRVTVRLPNHPVELPLDADAVKQALINVIDNAVKYSREKKSLDVELRTGGRVEIRVTDEGIGIAAEDIPKIFEKFFRTEAADRLAPQGAGLGLKIVKHIMEAHGGQVRVESDPGRGSTFRLLFGGP